VNAFKDTTLTALVLAIATGVASAAAGYKQADKTGEAINALRTDVAKIKTSVDESLKALDALVAAASTNPRKAYDSFAKTVDKVDDAAQDAKKKAEKMRERGAEFFNDWEKQLAELKNEEIRKLAAERRAKLQETFGNIKNGIEDAKTAFTPFLGDLKDLRTALASDLTVQGIESAKDVLKKTKTSGVEVQKNLDALVTELNTVAAAITASAVKPAK
jgi:methyl-accepting chemotaxis protein